MRLYYFFLLGGGCNGGGWAQGERLLSRIGVYDMIRKSEGTPKKRQPVQIAHGIGTYSSFLIMPKQLAL